MKICYICKEKFNFKNKYLKGKKYRKVRDHCNYTRKYRGADHSIFNLKYSASKKIPIVFHNVSNYDYHFIIKELAEEFKKAIYFFRREHWIYITFTVLIQNEVARIDKNGLENTKDKFYILQLTDSARFMASSLSNLVNNLSEGIHTIICKFRNDDTKCETCGIKYKYCDCFLEYTHFRGDLIE